MAGGAVLGVGGGGGEGLGVRTAGVGGDAEGGAGRSVVDKVAKGDRVDDAVLAVDGLDGEGEHGDVGLVLGKGGGVADELPVTGVDLTHVCAHGATADDEADVDAGEIGPAGKVDRDRGAVDALGGCVAHHPEQVDRGAGEAGGSARGEVVAGGGEGGRKRHDGGERRAAV